MACLPSAVKNYVYVCEIYFIFQFHMQKFLEVALAFSRGLKLM